MAENKHIPGRLQISTECNQDCLFCSVPKDSHENPTIEDLKIRMNKLKELGSNDLFITGGEPLIHPQLFSILDYAKELGFQEVTIQSNCAAADGKTLDKIKAYGNVKFNISFHSFKKDVFNNLSSSLHYEAFIKNLGKVCEKNIGVYLTIVINKLNYPHLKDHIEFIRKNFPQIRHFSLNFIDPSGRAKDNACIVPTLAETAQSISETAQYILDNGMTFRLERVPLCFMDGFEEFSTEARLPAFNEKRMTYFAEEKRENLNIEEKKEYIKPQLCSFCSLNALCPGINPNYAAIHGLSEIFPSFKNAKIIEQRIQSTKVTLENPGKNKKPIVGESFDDAVKKDLLLFEFAIHKKPNKNNIYDTYAHFLMQPVGIMEEDFVFKSWQQFMERYNSGKEQDLFTLYIHFPFCQSNCDYCVYPSTALANPQQVEDYLAYLASEIKKYSQLFTGIKFKALSIGGGTPSLMSASQLNSLLKDIFLRFAFEKEGEKSIEFNPHTTTPDKLQVLQKFKFNKLSFGVQSLSPNVLKQVNREYQNAESIRKAILEFKKAELGYLNVDLLLGLRGDTPEDFLYTFEEICKYGPDLISVYPIKTNGNYIQERYGNEKAFFDFYYPLFEEVKKRVLPIAERFGYMFEGEDISKISYVHPFAFVRKGHAPKIKYNYSNFRTEPYSNLGIGFYAESCINNMIRYICVDSKKPNTLFLKKFSTNPEDYKYFVNVFLRDYDRVKFIASQVSESHSIPRKEYLNLFGRDICEDFSYAIKALKQLGKIFISDEKISFNITSEKEVYPYLLFFVGRNKVSMKVLQK